MSWDRGPSPDPGSRTIPRRDGFRRPKESEFRRIGTIELVPTRTGGGGRSACKPRASTVANERGRGTFQGTAIAGRDLGARSGLLLPGGSGNRRPEQARVSARQEADTEIGAEPPIEGQVR